MLIYKYILKRDTGEQRIEMPRVCVPLSFGLDPQGQLCVWVLVNTDQPKAFAGTCDNPAIEHRFFVGFTGEAGPELPLDMLRRNGCFLGTVNDHGLMRHGFHLGPVST